MIRPDLIRWEMWGMEKRARQCRRARRVATGARMDAAERSRGPSGCPRVCLGVQDACR
jgi:hypothetical protein